VAGLHKRRRPVPATKSAATPPADLAVKAVPPVLYTVDVEKSVDYLLKPPTCLRSTANRHLPLNTSLKTCISPSPSPPGPSSQTRVVTADSLRVVRVFPAVSRPGSRHTYFLRCRDIFIPIWPRAAKEVASRIKQRWHCSKLPRTCAGHRMKPS
jgi:hypothetical protein